MNLHRELGVLAGERRYHRLSSRRLTIWSATMSFDVAADAYDRFMGRYSRVLSPAFADFAGVRAGQRVLDVGCGPGALTIELLHRLGPPSVAAVDPSEPFVAAARERHPGVDVRRSSAEDIPHPDGAFEVAMAQLVVHFMRDPVGRARGDGACDAAGRPRGGLRPGLRGGARADLRVLAGSSRGGHRGP